MIRGNKDADIWIILGYPTVKDEYNGEIASGSTGREMETMLRDVGIDINQCYIAPVTFERPTHQDLAKSQYFCTKTQAPKKGYLAWGDTYVHPNLHQSIQALRKTVAEAKPKMVIAFGELPLLALTENSGITNWRGSHLTTVEGIKCIPTYEPAKVMVMWEWRFIAVQDLRRAARERGTEEYTQRPTENYITNPTYNEAKSRLQHLIHEADKAQAEGCTIPYAVDVETRFGHITHFGVAWSEDSALAIRFSRFGELDVAEASTMSAEEETDIAQTCRALLSHPAVVSVGQNFLYDIQYFAHDWGVIPSQWEDTMTAWHVLYAGLQKSLAFISSMVLPHYEYWKDSSPDEEPAYSIYNCRDCARTWAIWRELKLLLKQQNQWDQYQEQIRAQRPNLKCMLRGFRQDIRLRQQLGMELLEAMNERECWLHTFTSALTGDQPLTKSKKAQPWYRSPTQQQKIFYELLGLPVVRNKKTGRPSCDDWSLQKLKKKEPLLTPIFDIILEYRSLGVFFSTFIQSPLDWDNRIRSSFGVGATETFRNTSSADVFGFGGNLQNIPKGNE